jgi:hypothetical protein
VSSWVNKSSHNQKGPPETKRGPETNRRIKILFWEDQIYPGGGEPEMEPRAPELDARELELDARRSSEIGVKKHPEKSTWPQKCINILSPPAYSVLQKGSCKSIKILNLITEIMATSIIKLEMPGSTSLRNDSGEAVKTLTRYATNSIFVISKLTAPSFLNNSSYSDITILLGTTGIELPAHRIILAHRSPRIHNSLMRVPETEVLQFDFNGCSAHSYWRVFHYMYEERYSTWPTEVLSNIGRSFRSNASHRVEGVLQKTSQSY